MRTGIYIRVSTDEQAQEGYSIRAQEERLIAYCQSQDWEVTKIYRDEGYSAKDIKRPQLTHLIEDIKERKIDVVLVYRLDRFTRSVLDLHKLLDLLDENNCKFKSATEPFDTTSATGRMFITIVAALAEWERGTLVERVNFAMLKKANLGEWSGGHVPLGYDLNNGELFINEDEANIIKRVFELRKLYSVRETTRRLTEEGLTNRGKPFTRQGVRYIATNPLYIGKIRYNEGPRKYLRPLDEQRIFDGKHEPIIDEETFWSVNKTTPNRRKRAGNFIFSNLYCGRCGDRIYGCDTQQNKSGISKYYRCNGNTEGKKCNQPRFNENALIRSLLNNIDQYIENVYEEQQTIISDEQQRDVEQELNGVRRKMDKYKMMFMNDIISIEELNKSVNELKDKEKELEQLINEQPEFINKNVLLNFNTLWHDANDQEKKLLIESVFTSIVIDVDESKKTNRDVIIKDIS